MTRRRMGFALLIAGGAMTTFAGSRYVSGAAAQERGPREDTEVIGGAQLRARVAEALQAKEGRLVARRAAAAGLRLRR